MNPYLRMQNLFRPQGQGYEPYPGATPPYVGSWEDYGRDNPEADLEGYQPQQSAPQQQSADFMDPYAQQNQQSPPLFGGRGEGELPFGRGSQYGDENSNLTTPISNQPIDWRDPNFAQQQRDTGPGATGMPLGDPNQQEPYTPDTYAQERLNDMILTAPVRQKPNWKQRVVGAMVAAGEGGRKGADEVKYGQYNREMEDWKAKLQPVEYAANLERYGNVNERQQAYQSERIRQYDEAQAEKERANLVKEENARLRTKAYTFRQEHADWELKTTEGGELVWFSPEGKQVKTGMKSSDLDDYDLETLRQKGRIEAIRERGKYAPGTYIVDDDGNISMIPRGPGQKTQPVVTPEGKPAEGKRLETEKEETEANKAKGIENRIAEVYNTDPNSHKYFTGKPGDKKFGLKPPESGYIHGPVTKEEADEFNRIKERIYGKGGTEVKPGGRESLGTTFKREILGIEEGGKVHESSKRKVGALIKEGKKGVSQQISPSPSIKITPHSVPGARGPENPVVKSGPKIQNPNDRVRVQYQDDDPIWIPREQLPIVKARPGFKILSQ